ncbi:MAG: glycogen debranching enzyme family protein [Anaerolineae bacterium]|nr:glycogen debranching enzyme family protein [Anaerolineae bacterium]
MPPPPRPPLIRFGREITGDPDALLRREWLVTNGIGGYAMGTAAGARTRRYHGLLAAALKPPTQRALLVAGLDAWAEIDGTRYPLCAHEWAAGVLLPDGYRNLESFALDGLIPTFTWSIADVQIVARLWMEYGKNTTYLTYEYRRGTRPVTLQLTPLCTHRDHHGNTHGGAAVNVRMTKKAIYEVVTLQPARDLGVDPEDDELLMPHSSSKPAPYQLLCNSDKAEALGEWWWSFSLSQETERELDDHEDLFAAATFHKTLKKAGDVCVLICTAEQDSELPRVWTESLAAQRFHQDELLAHARLHDSPEWLQRLALAADQFIVSRTVAGDSKGLSVMAGYPWFADWGRDTMIALPGLTLAVGRPRIAERILRTFAEFIDQGMLPNRFPDDGDEPEYNTCDATLWYFEAIRQYLAQETGNSLLRKLYPKLKQIIEWHIKGTRYGIGVDPADGLLYTGEEGTQLTWMDVKVEDWVVTPRQGKPVEINALWHNALLLMRDLAGRLEDDQAAHDYGAMAVRVAQSFNRRFWYDKGAYLYDVVDAPEGDDASLRPNQLIAVSLGNDLLNSIKAKQVVDACARTLLTSYGLRTLDPHDDGYIGHYTGDIPSRDGAYHQGTAWSWLIGPFVAAHYAVYHDAHAAFSFLQPFVDHLRDAGVGTISEIFEGDAPHTPKGCIAQAWGVAEVLRVYRLLEGELGES